MNKNEIQKRKAPTFVDAFFFEIRQLPYLPIRVQISTSGNVELNFCVRNGNRWILYFIITGMVI